MKPESQPQPDPQPQPQPQPAPKPRPKPQTAIESPHRYWHPDNGVQHAGGLADVQTVARWSRIGQSTIYRWVKEGRLRRCVISRHPLRFDWDLFVDELADRRWRK